MLNIQSTPEYVLHILLKTKLNHTHRHVGSVWPSVSPMREKGKMGREEGERSRCINIMYTVQSDC